MATIDPYMGLRIWTQGSNPYDRDQLATNFAKLGIHDHTQGRGVQIPTEGIFDGAITVAKLAAAIDPTPGYNAWRYVVSQGIVLPGGQAAGTYPFYADPSNTPAVATSTNNAYWIDPADFPVGSSGRALQFRIRSILTTNLVAPGTTLTAGFYPVTPSYAASGSVSTMTLGTVVTGSTVAFTTPGASSSTPQISSAFSITTAGLYIIAVQYPAGLAAGAYVALRGAVQTRQL